MRLKTNAKAMAQIAEIRRLQSLAADAAAMQASGEQRASGTALKEQVQRRNDAVMHWTAMLDRTILPLESMRGWTNAVQEQQALTDAAEQMHKAAQARLDAMVAARAVAAMCEGHAVKAYHEARKALRDRVENALLDEAADRHTTRRTLW